MIVLGEKSTLVEIKPKRQFTNQSIKLEALFSAIALGSRVGRKAQENESAEKALTSLNFYFKCLGLLCFCCPVFNQGHTIGCTFESLEVNSHHKKHGEALKMD